MKGKELIEHLPLNVRELFIKNVGLYGIKDFNEKEFTCPGKALYSAFFWDDTPQGHDFWSSINKKLREIMKVVVIIDHDKYFVKGEFVPGEEETNIKPSFIIHHIVLDDSIQYGNNKYDITSMCDFVECCNKSGLSWREEIERICLDSISWFKS